MSKNNVFIAFIAESFLCPAQVIAQRRVRLLRIQRQKQQEAERLRREEEERLKKEKNLKSAEARREADRRYQVCHALQAEERRL